MLHPRCICPRRASPTPAASSTAGRDPCCRSCRPGSPEPVDGLETITTGRPGSGDAPHCTGERLGRSPRSRAATRWAVTSPPGIRASAARGLARVARYPGAPATGPRPEAGLRTPRAPHARPPPRRRARDVARGHGAGGSRDGMGLPGAALRRGGVDHGLPAGPLAAAGGPGTDGGRGRGHPRNHDPQRPAVVGALRAEDRGGRRVRCPGRVRVRAGGLRCGGGRTGTARRTPPRVPPAPPTA